MKTTSIGSGRGVSGRCRARQGMDTRVVPKPKERSSARAVALEVHSALRQTHMVVRIVKQAKCEVR